MNSFSKTVSEHAELWWEWRKMHKNAINSELNPEIRANCARKAEKTIEEINKKITALDVILENYCGK
jgi:hypothetical protein